MKPNSRLKKREVREIKEMLKENKLNPNEEYALQEYLKSLLKKNGKK